MDYKGKVYAKINGKYIECTETIQQLEDKISKLEEALGKNLPKITEEEINEIMEIVGFPEIEYKTEVHEDEYKGTDLEGFPPEVVEWMKEQQVKQGNKADVEVFKNNRNACYKGFDWHNTKEKYEFCHAVILDKRFDLFFEKYPKTK